MTYWFPYHKYIFEWGYLTGLRKYGRCQSVIDRNSVFSTSIKTQRRIYNIIYPLNNITKDLKRPSTNRVNSGEGWVRKFACKTVLACIEQSKAIPAWPTLKLTSKLADCSRWLCISSKAFPFLDSILFSVEYAYLELTHNLDIYIYFTFLI